jgi:hypothetical protein
MSMFGSPSVRIVAIILVVIAIVYPPEIFGSGITKRVVFPKGKGVVTYRGKLPRNSDYDAYFFTAQKGRFLSIKLISTDRDAYFAVYETKVLGPDEDTIVANDKRSLDWTGSLPVSGEYSVQVYDALENGINAAAYTIELTMQ